MLLLHMYWKFPTTEAFLRNILYFKYHPLDIHTFLRKRYFCFNSPIHIFHGAVTIFE